MKRFFCAWLACVMLLAPVLPVLAADTPTPTVRPVMTTLKFRVALRIVARQKMRDGELSRDQFRQIRGLLNDRSAREAVADLAVDCDAAYCEGLPEGQVGDWQTFLDWLIENWPEILEMIMSIIDLFAQDVMPATVEGLCTNNLPVPLQMAA